MLRPAYGSILGRPENRVRVHYEMEKSGSEGRDGWMESRVTKRLRRGVADRS